MKANVFLRKKGLNCDFVLKGSEFKGTLLELLNEFNSLNQVKNGDTVKSKEGCGSVFDSCRFKFRENCTSIGDCEYKYQQPE